MNTLQGAGGGSGSQTRTEDNLLSDDFVEVLLGISEGPIKGLVGTTDTERGQSIFVGQTPLINADGNPNFSNTSPDGTPSNNPGFSWANYLGTESDTPVEFALGGTSTNQVVGVVLATNTPVTRTTLSAVRGLMTLLQVRVKIDQLYTSDENGTWENTIEFKIEYKASSSSTWTNTAGAAGFSSVTGKTTSGYLKEYSFVVPALAADDYDIRVTKLSPVSTARSVTDMSWESYQMLVPGNRSFADLALLHFKARATNQFSSIPEFSGIYDGWVMSVPTNYNPELHTYDEATPWDGSFKQECTSNPAWVLYNLIVNTRLGLARYYKNVAANRYAFYKVAKWCDEMVADGGVGLQPRFTFNEVVTQQRNGLEFLQYVAGSFNATLIDDENGIVHLRTDVYETPLQIFCPENVATEGFQYTYSDITSRTNFITVSFTNPDMDWNEDQRIYEDPTLYHGSTLIDTNGRIPSDFIAVGCTNHHEATRRAAYRLRSANTEVTSVSFLTARLGMLTAVFDTIYVADPTSGWSTPGRIKSVVDNVVNLRDAIYFETLDAVTMAIQTAGVITEITVVPPALGLQSYFTKTVGDFPGGGDLSTAVFTIQGGTFGLLKPFRVMAIEELEEGGKAYRITALEINVNKYTDVESGVVSEPTQYSYRTPDFPLSPIGLTAVSGASEIRASTVTGALQFFIFLEWQIPALSYASSYDVEWKEQATGVWIKEAPFMGNSILIGPVREEVYYDLRVTAVSPRGTRSRPTYVNNHFVPKHLVGPPNYHYFDVTFGATGRRYVTFGYETAAPPGVVGARIRFLEGSYGPGTWPAWNSMYPLHDGLMTGSFESDGGVPGDYAVAIVAVDISGNQSYGPIYLQRTLEVVHPPLYDNFDLVFDAAGRRYFTFGFTGAAPTSVWGAHLRFAVGFGTPVWETMTPLHDGVMTGSFDTAGGASGEFTVAIKSVNFAGTESSSFLSLQRTVPEAQGASTTIANYDKFEVAFDVSGRRFISFSYNGTPPIDLAGARIRFVVGFVTNPDWATMEPLYDGIMTGSFDSAGGAPGDYTVAIKAVSLTGIECATPRYLQRTLEVVHPPLYDNFDLVFDAAGRRYFTFGFTGAAPASVWGAHLRYAVGFGTPVWETMTPLHDGVMTGSFDTAGGASGEFTVAIKSVNFAGTESSSFLSLQRTVPEAQGASTTIANYDKFEVAFDVSGRRFISFSYNGTPPIDLAGARIRFVVGFVTNPDWATMEPLYDGIMTGSFDSAGGAPGDYTVAIKAVSLTGIECATPRYLQRALPTVGQSGIVISPTAPSVTYPQQLWLDTSGT